MCWILYSSMPSKLCSKNVDQAISQVKDAYNQISNEMLYNNVLSYHCTMESSIYIGDGNNYKLANMDKEKVWWEGLNPETILHIYKVIDRLMTNF